MAKKTIAMVEIFFKDDREFCLMEHSFCPTALDTTAMRSPSRMDLPKGSNIITGDWIDRVQAVIERCSKFTEIPRAIVILNASIQGA